MTTWGAAGLGWGCAVVTGASSGIGEAFARALAARGLALVLVGRREERLRAVADSLGSPAEVRVVDLAHESALVGLINELTARRVSMLVNNAGFGVPGLFEGGDTEEMDTMIRVHVHAPVRLARAVLPGMLARRSGAVVNVASIGALLPDPGDAMYCGTKSFLLTFSEALHREVRSRGVRVQALCPGFTRTEFHARPPYARVSADALVPGSWWLAPGAVVDASLRGLERGRPVVVPGWRYRALWLLARLGLGGLLVSLFQARLRAK